MKHTIFLGLCLSLISVDGHSASKQNNNSPISNRFVHVGECVNYFNDPVTQKYQSILVYSFDSNGVQSKTPLLKLDRGRSECTTFPKNGYYKLSYFSGKAEKYQTSIAVLPSNIVSNSNMGVVTHFGNLKKSSEPDIILPMIKAAGISWIRDELYWQNVESEKGKFKFPQKYDDYVEGSQKYGLKTLVVLDYGNRNYGGTQLISNSIPNFLLYVTEIVKRYGKYVNHWEVWNEPKPKLFGTATWEGYSNFLEQVYLKIKSLQSDSVVIACGGGGAGGGPGGDCVKNIIKFKGSNVFDAFSIHPYLTKTPEIGYSSFNSPFKNFGGYVNADSVSKLLTSFDRNNFSKNGKKYPVYITEVGWPSSSKKGVNSERLQASYAVRFYLLLKKYNIYPVVFWYDFRNDGIDPGNQEHNFGLIREDYSPKMSYVALATYNSVLAGYNWDREIYNKDGAVINQYVNGKSTIQVGWTINDLEYRVDAPSQSNELIDWQGNRFEGKQGPWILSLLPSYRIIK